MHTVAAEGRNDMHHRQPPVEEASSQEAAALSAHVNPSGNACANGTRCNALHPTVSEHVGPLFPSTSGSKTWIFMFGSLRWVEFLSYPVRSAQKCARQKLTYAQSGPSGARWLQISLHSRESEQPPISRIFLRPTITLDATNFGPGPAREHSTPARQCVQQGPSSFRREVFRALTKQGNTGFRDGRVEGIKEPCGGTNGPMKPRGRNDRKRSVCRIAPSIVATGEVLKLRVVQAIVNSSI